MTRSGHDLAVLDGGVGRGDVGLGLLVGPQPDDFVGQLALVHLAVGRDEEAVLVDAGVNRQARNQADVRAFRRLDRADAAVVRNMHVADFEAGPLAVQDRRGRGPTAAARA